MALADQNDTPVRLQGKRSAMTVCWLLGMGSLLSWNSMLTIGDYYYKVFPRYHPSRVIPLSYQPFALGVMVILAYHGSKINTRKRIITGYTLFFIASLLCIVLDLATSGHGGIKPYIGLCVLVGSFGVAGALVEGGMVGDMAFMLPDFIQSFFAGMGFSGALTSGLRLVTKAIFDKAHNGLRKGALSFLAISTVIEFLCIYLYAYYFPKLPIVQHYRSKAASEGLKTVSSDLAAVGIHKAEGNVKVEDQLNNKQLLLQNLDYELHLFLTYALTLSIFPGFLYENTGHHSLGEWYALVLIAVYNIWDLVGRYAPLISCLKLESRKGLMTAVMARFLFIPAFYITAKYADQGWMIMLTSLLGFTNGHLTVCVMTAAPKGYKGPEQNALGNFLVVFLLSGGVVWVGCGSLETRAFDEERRDQNVMKPMIVGKPSAMIVCWLLGMGTLLSWNSVLTIGDYYYKVFPRYHPSRVIVLLYHPFALGAMAILAYNASMINTRKRIIAGYTLFFISNLLCILQEILVLNSLINWNSVSRSWQLDIVTCGHGGPKAYIGLCILVASFGVGGALVQGGMVGDLSCMLPEFIQSYFAGVAFSGALTSGLRLATKASFERSHNGLRKGACKPILINECLLFLAISTAIEFVCIFLYAYYFPKLPIIKLYRSKAASQGLKTVSSDLAAVGIHKASCSRHSCFN
ncbi:hypothetical protein Cgig2_003328 [Carnegiea gigantea]|uniref:Uncharacterized protein n=1 Tax=Carnegiea gigantea TaxID=171969 RepID=A0A9Q1K1P2_9CARY|nr:hypothetical protein Cgig2_003328 [Carnegiea gigantea]